MSNLIIKQGVFFKDGIEQKPEIGNLEQIECKKKTDRFAYEGLKVSPNYGYKYASVNFKCICGNTIFHHIDQIEIEDDEIFDERLLYCRTCYLRYIFNLQSDGLYIKLIF